MSEEENKEMTDLILLLDNLEKQFDYQYESMKSSIETIRKELDSLKNKIRKGDK